MLGETHYPWRIVQDAYRTSDLSFRVQSFPVSDVFPPVRCLSISQVVWPLADTFIRCNQILYRGTAVSSPSARDRKRAEMPNHVCLDSGAGAALQELHRRCQFLAFLLRLAQQLQFIVQSFEHVLLLLSGASDLLVANVVNLVLDFGYTALHGLLNELVQPFLVSRELYTGSILPCYP